MRVLIVDDDRTVLEDNREYFEKMGYETVCADTSGAAEEIINSAALDCVILDIDLPDGNGFEPVPASGKGPACRLCSSPATRRSRAA